MKLNMIKRDAAVKSEVKKLRRSGYIPGVIYAKGQECVSVAVSAAEFDALLRSIQKGRLSTTVVSLVDEQGVVRRAIVKEIQYDVTSYEVINLDFEELHDNVPVNVKVPIEFLGVADCVGIKLGGVLRQVIRQVRVRCLPQQIPSNFTLDVSGLAIKQSLRLSDIAWPAELRPLANLDEVAVVIAKR